LEENEEFIIPYALRLNKSRWSENVVGIVPGSYKYTPNEIMMGKIWATKFGLREGDSIADILQQGSEFFMLRQSENYGTPLNAATMKHLYDAYLIDENGDHLHILLDTESNRKALARLGDKIKKNRI
jgi:hypothetical protein